MDKYGAFYANQTSMCPNRDVRDKRHKHSNTDR